MTWLCLPDLLACGSDVINTLRNAVHDLGGDLAGKTLDDLSDTAYAQLSSSHGTVCWRQLYTDRKLFRTLIGLIKPVDEKTAKICIARLDYAIIVAGPCEEGRVFVPIPLFLLRISAFYDQQQAIASIAVVVNVLGAILHFAFIGLSLRFQGCLRGSKTVHSSCRCSPGSAVLFR